MVRLQVVHASEFFSQEKPKTNHMFSLVDSLKAHLGESNSNFLKYYSTS